MCQKSSSVYIPRYINKENENCDEKVWEEKGWWFMIKYSWDDEARRICMFPYFLIFNNKKVVDWLFKIIALFCLKHSLYEKYPLVDCTYIQVFICVLELICDKESAKFFSISFNQIQLEWHIKC